jgi:hypothetical protein
MSVTISQDDIIYFVITDRFGDRKTTPSTPDSLIHGLPTGWSP